MNSTVAREFQNRIASAGQGDLLMITYDMLFVSLEDALKAIETDNPEAFNSDMNRAQRLLRELSDNLDFKYEISKDLMSIYIYTNKELIDASIKMDREPIERSLSVLRLLYDGFDQVADEDNKKPLIQNSQRVYAGLTYGKGVLNETIYNQSNSRGFKA